MVAASPMLLPPTPHATVKIAQEHDKTDAKYQTVNLAYGALVVFALTTRSVGEIRETTSAGGWGWAGDSLIASKVSLGTF